MTVDWTMVGALATVAYTLSFLISVGFLAVQLRRQTEERFVDSTQTTFQIWMDDDFQRAQQWVLYEMEQTRWKDFVAQHRGGYGERAFVRVGSFYNRIGYLVVYHLLGQTDRVVLDTLAGSAIAVWERIESLVLEARLTDNSTMFQDFERMLPRCRECYVASPTVARATVSRSVAAPGA